MLNFLNGKPATITLTLEDALARINALALDIARLERRVLALEHSAAGKLPTLVDCTTARKTLAYLGISAGASPDDDTANLAARQALTSHKAFSELRMVLEAKGISIVSHMGTLTWLAGPSKVAPTETRYALILRGAYTPTQLRRAEA